MVKNGWRLPESDRFSIRNTSHSGRGVFTKKEVAPGTHLLTTTSNLSPLAHVILRPYQREVCSQCFTYDRGREWKIRDQNAGLVFCSEDCQSQWFASNPGLVHEAYQAVTVATNKKQQQKNGVNESRDILTPDGNHRETATPQERQKAHMAMWEETALLGQRINDIRIKQIQSKLERRILRIASELSPDPDVLKYLLSGVVAFYKAATENQSLVLEQETSDSSCVLLLPSLFELAPDVNVYEPTPTGPSSLEDYLHAYRLLIAILPLPLLRYVQPNICYELASRASHNAFSIRPTGTSDGEHSGEFLGWGVWPEASFFNHSCRPNVRKERKGRNWTFWVKDNETVLEGDELCISYLGGDEKELDVHERRKRLKDEWGFWCCCNRCIIETDQV